MYRLLGNRLGNRLILSEPFLTIGQSIVPELILQHRLSKLLPMEPRFEQEPPIRWPPGGILATSS